MYPDFGVHIVRSQQGIEFVLHNAPVSCFRDVDGTTKPEAVIREHLSAAARDLIYENGEIQQRAFDSKTAIFHLLRHANFFERSMSDEDGESLPNRRIYAWGGHAISQEEYRHTKIVGQALAMQRFELITGGGPGIMRGTLSGALAGYERERINGARRFGFSCPSIITSEPPNSLVKPLIILPNIETRIEAFIRGAIAGIICPGGPGTAEEFLTKLSILMNDKNANIRYPLVLTGPQGSTSYFEALENFIIRVIPQKMLQERELYAIITEGYKSDAYSTHLPIQDRVAKYIADAVHRAELSRQANDDSIEWCDRLFIGDEVCKPFDPTHESMAQLQLHSDQPAHMLLAELRKLFSGVVFGNVSDKGVRLVQEHGKFEISGESHIIAALGDLLERFVSEKRMKISGPYEPCYTLRPNVRKRRTSSRNTPSRRSKK